MTFSADASMPLHQMLATSREETTHDFQPRTFDEYLGQAALKEKLHVYTTAARMRNEPLDHLLLFGPPGLGKTTLAHIMAQVMGCGMRVCSGPMLERTGDLVAILSSLEPRDILFIDEIHRMPIAVEEILYSAMEQFKVDVIIGQGAGARSMSLPLHPFTLIGATTKSGLLSAPLRSRFGITERLEFYTEADLGAIVAQSAHFLGMELEHETACIIARCGRGTPRIAKKLLRRVRDYAQVYEHTRVTPELAHTALSFLGIAHDGLSVIDERLLHILLERFNGGPAGIETLAALVGEDVATLEDAYEPYLLRCGYIEKTPRGRQIPAAQRVALLKRLGGQNTLL